MTARKIQLEIYYLNRWLEYKTKLANKEEKVKKKFIYTFQDFVLFSENEKLSKK